MGEVKGISDRGGGERSPKAPFCHGLGPLRPRDYWEGSRMGKTRAEGRRRWPLGREAFTQLPSIPYPVR
jgi:hypothetical protein